MNKADVIPIKLSHRYIHDEIEVTKMYLYLIKQMKIEKNDYVYNLS